jgi:hypothetical protein
VIAVLLVLASGAGWAQSAALDELGEKYPTQELSPAEVVEIQMEAFRNNDDEDTGIAIAFRFASPQNKRSTGPLPRFRIMMRNPMYKPMLEAEEVEIAATDVREQAARIEVVTVAPDGTRDYYAFFLGKQRGGDYEGAWMTEAVQVLSNNEAAPEGSV